MHFYTGALCWDSAEGGVDFSKGEQVSGKESRVQLLRQASVIV